MRHKKFTEYRRLTIRLSPEKFRQLKVELAKREITLQEWLESQVENFLRECEDRRQYMHTCGQVGCNEDAKFRFTWPGKDEDFICSRHADWMRNISAAMGLHVQLIPLLETEDITDE